MYRIGEFAMVLHKIYIQDGKLYSHISYLVLWGKYVLNPTRLALAIRHHNGRVLLSATR